MISLGPSFCSEEYRHMLREGEAGFNTFYGQFVTLFPFCLLYKFYNSSKIKWGRQTNVLNCSIVSRGQARFLHKDFADLSSGTQFYDIPRPVRNPSAKMQANKEKRQNTSIFS